jgi:hypothetical protein
VPISRRHRAQSLHISERDRPTGRGRCKCRDRQPHGAPSRRRCYHNILNHANVPGSRRQNPRRRRIRVILPQARIHPAHMLLRGRARERDVLAYTIDAGVVLQRYHIKCVLSGSPACFRAAVRSTVTVTPRATGVILGQLVGVAQYAVRNRLDPAPGREPDRHRCGGELRPRSHDPNQSRDVQPNSLALHLMARPEFEPASTASV